MSNAVNLYELIGVAGSEMCEYFKGVPRWVAKCGRGRGSKLVQNSLTYFIDGHLRLLLFTHFRGRLFTYFENNRRLPTVKSHMQHLKFKRRLIFWCLSREDAGCRPTFRFEHVQLGVKRIRHICYNGVK